MNWEAKYTALRQYIDSNWTATPKLWENQPVNLPDAYDSFITVQIIPTDDRQITMGGQGYRHYANLYCDVFVPQQAGTAIAEEKARQLALLFRGITYQGMMFRTPTIRSSGRTRGPQDGEFFRVTVMVPFEFDYT